MQKCRPWHSRPSLAPNDKSNVTLSGAASEAAESKGPPRLSDRLVVAVSRNCIGGPSCSGRCGSDLSMADRAAATIDAVLTRWGSFDSLADSLAQDDVVSASLVIPRVAAAPRRGGARDDVVSAFPVIP